MGRCFVALERDEVHNPDDPAIPVISLRSLHADGGHAGYALLVAAGRDAGAEAVLLRRCRAVPRGVRRNVDYGVQHITNDMLFEMPVTIAYFNLVEKVVAAVRRRVNMMCVGSIVTPPPSSSSQLCLRLPLHRS